MRLIDADALFKQLREENIPFNADINEIINIQPTAYDVEKVVAELETRRSDFDCKSCKHFYNGKEKCNADCTDALIDDLIEIVRKGGRE